MFRRLVIVAAFIAAAPTLADDSKVQTVEQIAERYKKSLAVITTPGRDGKRQGLGTGFVVAADGLIATNLHVIGEGRAITVELPDGTKHEVTTIHATDRANDLAIVRIAANKLAPLELGDSNTLKDGQSVVALGNPQGLKYSVVGGVVSGQRELDGRKMIQLAIPLEPGNSGGPLLDMTGQVRGILTLKSAVTENLGFAMPVNALKPLIAKPNPVAMDRWLTIGALDLDEWTPLFGARWRQRAGRVQVDGVGSGFGGRSLCLSKKAAPPMPFEVAVSVKLDDEAGAAGLVFHADGNEKHYGFYPTNGELRLTRFDGADVYSWKILAQKRSESYRPGEWNVLRVRVEKGKLSCFINDQLAIESTDDELTTGQVGLAKFRNTVAEFKGFALGRSLHNPAATTAADRTKLSFWLSGKSIPENGVDELTGDAAANLTLLRAKAAELDKQASELRKLAQAVHEKRVREQLVKLFSQPDDKIDLVHAALLIALLDNDELEVEAYRKEVDRLAKKLLAAMPAKASGSDQRAALNKYFFEERGFHGSRADYYHRSNSYLNEVIDDREGIPITLSILYMELARRIGMRMEGVGLPGHFVVRHVPADAEAKLVDVYDGGKELSREEAAEKVRNISGIQMTEAHLKPISKRAIVARMVQNLLNLTRDDRDMERALRYLNVLLDLDPEAVRERWMRAVVTFQTGRKSQARIDADWLLERSPEGVNLEQVRELRRLLDRP